jgi:hypothetical protein
MICLHPDFVVILIFHFLCKFSLCIPVFWKYANSKRKTNTGISELKFKSEEGEERKTTTDKEKAEVLAIFFSSVFTIEPEGDLPLMHPIEVKQECIEKTCFSVSSPTSMFLFNLLYGFSIQRNIVVFLSFVVGFCIHMWYIFVFCLIELGHKNVKLLPSIFSF